MVGRADDIPLDMLAVLERRIVRLAPDVNVIQCLVPPFHLHEVREVD
jgi:hypothetical protein